MNTVGDSTAKVVKFEQITTINEWRTNIDSW